MSRNTNTGGVLENMVMPALERGGYSSRKQVNVGIRLGSKSKHMVDAIAEKDGRKILISLKWQQTSGTAEQKVPFEIMCLAEAIEDNEGQYEKAYLVLGGEGWKLREYFTSGNINKYMRATDAVKIITLERFIAQANSAAL